MQSPGKRHYKEECYTIKVVKKYDIIVKGLIRQVMEEKDVLRLVYGHPFVVSLYSCFQTEVIFQIYKYDS
jgi:serine/threonine protein kinase